MQDHEKIPSIQKDLDERFLETHFQIQSESLSLRERFKRWIYCSELSLYVFGNSPHYSELQRLNSYLYEQELAGLARFEQNSEVSDILIIVSPINLKNQERVKKLYTHMRKPTWVIYFGTDSYEKSACPSTLIKHNVGHMIEADVIIPGRYPRPETLIQAITKIRKLIKHGISPKGMNHANE